VDPPTPNPVAPKMLGAFRPLASGMVVRAAALVARPVHHSTQRMASTLVIADHNNLTLFPATLSAVTAAGKLGGDITVLVGGASCGAVAEAVAKVVGVKSVIKADSECLGKGNAENMTSLVLKLQVSQPSDSDSARTVKGVIAALGAGARLMRPLYGWPAYDIAPAGGGR